MRLAVLRENLAHLHELEEAAGNVRYGIDGVDSVTEVKIDLVYRQVKNFIDEVAKTVIDTYNNDRED